MNLFKHEKHDKDTVLTRYDKQFKLYIGSLSRHKEDGTFQGYLVGIEKLYGEKTYYVFKHYRYREVAELSAIGDYLREHGGAKL